MANETATWCDRENVCYFQDLIWVGKTYEKGEGEVPVWVLSGFVVVHGNTWESLAM